MCAAGPRPAIPALARMLENNADHACQTGAPTGLACLPLPQALLSFSIINGNGYHSQDQPHRQYPSNRHRAPLQLGAPPSATSCIAGLPTPADAACGCGTPRPASANLYNIRKPLQSVSNCNKLLDQLVGAGEQRWWDCEA